MMILNTEAISSSCKVMVPLVTTYSDGYTFQYLESLSVGAFG